MKDRLIAAGAVLVFFLLLRTNADPTMWQIAITAVGLYECVLMFIRAFEDGTKKTVHRRKVAQNVRFRNIRCASALPIKIVTNGREGCTMHVTLENVTVNGSDAVRNVRRTLQTDGGAQVQWA